MTFFKKPALAMAALSVAMTPYTPVMAANVTMNVAAAPSFRGTNGTLEIDMVGDYRRRYHHHRRHHHGLDGGDVLAGIGILAGIAIIANAASNKKRERPSDRYPEPDRNDYPQNYPPVENDAYTNDISSAVSACSAAVEQSGDGPVEAIRSVSRDGAGWRVEGQLGGNDDRGFSCGVTNGGVDFIQYDDR